MKYISLVACFLILLSSQGCAKDRYTRIEEAIPFVLESLDGAIVDSNDYFGKYIVLLNFWVTDCSVCEDEVPYLRRLYSNYKGELTLFAVDIMESKKKVERFVKSWSVDYPILLDKNALVARSYRIPGTPTIILIGKDKKIAYYGYDILEAEDVIKDLLKR